MTKAPKRPAFAIHDDAVKDDQAVMLARSKVDAAFFEWEAAATPLRASAEIGLKLSPVQLAACKVKLERATKRIDVAKTRLEKVIAVAKVRLGKPH